MATSVADLFVVLDSITDPFSKGMEKAAADAEAESGRMSKALKAVAAVGVGLAIGVGAIGIKSIDMATQFQSSMETLHTQAGVAQSQIAGLSNGVLNLAGQVGFSPDSLAEALYHIESSFASVGITGPKALDLLHIAAEGAAVGHADLVDVTNALDAAVASGIPGVQDFSQAMGVLNATVGAGDMTMQDLASAFSTGLLANVKSYGLSITDVGAALAVFGDNNIRGQNAATDLRMAVQAMAVPAKTAADQLQKMGMSSTTLADVMSKQGLLPALELLKARMTAVGVTAQNQGEVLTNLFGKKAGAGIVVLYDQLDRLKSKYPDLTKGANDFAGAWVATKATIAQQLKDIESGADALGVRLGEFLLPQVSKLITEGQTALGQIESGFTGADLKAPTVDYKNSRLNQDQLGLQQPQSAFEKFGQTVHTVMTDLDTLGRRLEPIGRNFATFGLDVFQAGEKIVEAVTPTVKLVGVGLFGALEVAGKAAANILGPAIKDFAGFLADHQQLIKYFSEVILGGMIVKMTVLGTLNAAEGIVKLATAVVSFPLGQASQIGDALSAVKAAFTGSEAKEGEQAVQGLAGALSNLKQAGSGVLDKILPDSGKLAALSQLGSEMSSVETEMTGVEGAAKGAGEQLSLLDENMQAIPWKMGHEQLSLFETDASGIETAAEGAAQQLPGMAQGMSAVEQEAGNAEEASTGLLGKIGKFALVGGGVGAAVFGLVTLGQTLGQLAGVGDHTAMSMEALNGLFASLGEGSATAGSELATASSGMAALSGIFGGSVQGLQQIDQGFAQMVSSGHISEAQSEFGQISAALQKQGLTAQQVAGDFPQYEQAIKNTGDAAQTMDGQVQGMQATLAKQQALTQFSSDLQGLTQSIQTNGNALFGNSQQAVANQQAISGAATDILNFYQQQRTAGVGIAGATTQMDLQIAALEKTAVKAGIGKGDVDQYIATLLNIPLSRVTQIVADTAPAQSALQKFLYQANNSSATVTVYENSSGTVLSPGSGGYKARAGGGPVEAGQTYIVGEDGPEIVTFGASGYVTPNQMLQPAALAGIGGPGGSAGGGTVVNNYFITQVAGSVLSDKKLGDVMRTVYLQYNSRNSANGLSLPNN